MGNHDTQARLKIAGLRKETRLLICTYRAEAAIEQGESPDTRSRLTWGRRSRARTTGFDPVYLRSNRSDPAKRKRE